MIVGPRQILAVFTVAIALLTYSNAAWAQELVADLTAHIISINSQFQGTSLVAFGSVEGGGDIILTVSGPQRDLKARRKTRVVGIWLNTEGVGFSDVPTYYAVLANKPTDTLLPLLGRRLNVIGAESIALQPIEADALKPASDIARFHRGLISVMQQEGFYAEQERPVEFLGKKLFRATLDFPASIPVGTYDVTAFLIRKGAVVENQTIPLIVSRSGFEAEVHDFAEHQSLIFGIFAVASAAVVGWVGSFLFRSI